MFHMDWPAIEHTLCGERSLGLHDGDNIIIIIVPLSRHVNKRIVHHNHHHVAQNNFVQAVFWGISNVTCGRLDYDTVCSGWMVSPSLSEVHSAANHNISKVEAVRNVTMHLPNYMVSLPGGPDEPSPSWKRYRVCYGCNLPVVGPMCRLECTFPNQLPR